MNLAARFGENMVRQRKCAGMSQEDLGFRAGLHRTEIGMLERGIRLPRLDTIIKLAGALEIEPADLIEGMTWRASRLTPGSFAAPSEESPSPPPSP